MKAIIFVAILGMMSLCATAHNQTPNFVLHNEVNKNLCNCMKEVNITIVLNGYTINIRGTINFNVLTGVLTMNVQVTITGNGVSITMPLSYTGTLGESKGVNKNDYDDSQISDDVKPGVEAIMSHIYLPEDKDPRLVRIDEFTKE